MKSEELAEGCTGKAGQIRAIVNGVSQWIDPPLDQRIGQVEEVIYLKIPKKSACSVLNLYNEERVCFGDCPEKQITCSSCYKNMIEFKIDPPMPDPLESEAYLTGHMDGTHQAHMHFTKKLEAIKKVIEE